MAKRQAISVWDYKPWWCQPWSILLTTVTLITGSWLLFHRYWFTGLVALPVMTWMIFFLAIYPRLVAESGLLPGEMDPPQTEHPPEA